MARLTVDRYLDLLETETFVIFRLRSFRTTRKEIAKRQKVFSGYGGIRNAACVFDRRNSGLTSAPLWENWV